MDTRLQKIWKDLLIRKARTVLALIGLVIGLWGISAVSVGYTVLSNDLAENYARTNPPNIVMDLRSPDPIDVIPISELDGVQSVENRALIFARIEIGRDNWLPLHLFVVEDFQQPHVATFFPESGEFPPPKGTMLIERDGELFMKFARLREANPAGGHGHRVQEPTLAAADSSSKARRIQLPGGVKLVTEISGTVFDPGLAPSRMELMIYGYVTRETAMSWMPDGFRNRLLVKVVTEQKSVAQRRQVAERIEAVLTRAGIAVAEVRFPSASDHPHQFQMNSILFLLAGLGVLALLMSAVLVLNLIRSLLANQIRQIGGLKAIGATSFQVATLYSGSMFLLGLAASAISLPLAKRAGFRLAEIISAILNFEILTPSLPWTSYGAIAFLGSLFPVVAACFSVRRWSHVTVRDALENYGVGDRRVGGSLIDHVKLPLPINSRLGVRNSLRNPARFCLSVLTMSLGALIFMIAMNIRSSLLRTAEVEEEGMLHDIAVSFENEVRWEQISWMSQFGEATDLELWQVSTAKPLSLAPAETEAYPLIAVPANTKALNPNLTHGRWISVAQPEGVVTNHRFMAKYPDLKVGDAISVDIEGHISEVEICGVIKEFRGAALYMPAKGYQALTGTADDIGKVALLTLKEKTDATRRKMISLLEQHFDLAGLTVTRVQATKIASRIIRNHLDVIVLMLGVAASLMLIVSGLGMASGMSTSVVERTREVGVLRAIGATPGAVLKILSTESIFIALVAWMIALLVAGPVSRLWGTYFGTAIVEYPFDYEVSLEGIWLSLLAVVTLALIATYGPVKMATRQAVQAAVSYE